MRTLLLIALLAAAWVALRAAVLRRAARAGGSAGTQLGRAVPLAALPVAAGVGLWAALAAAYDGAAAPLGLAAAVALADALLAARLVRWAAGRPPLRRGRAWAVQWAGGLAVAAVVFLTGGSCLGAAFIPNSSMSPNIRGYHAVEPLPDGTELVLAANTPGDAGIPPGEPSGAVVAGTYEYREVPRPERPTRRADWFVWDKMAAPRRWDAVVFSYPDRPGEKFVKRLVGLPGERLEIRDGSAWADGIRLVPPARLGPIRYTAFPLAGGSGSWQLGPGECFLLGDNTDHCSDSRLRGPVPVRLIDGVVAAIYWPPGRWRVRP